MQGCHSIRNQKGFTLIEIIAVLILLGILAAVAVPKYIELTAEAEAKSVAAVKAELQARANMYYGKYLLDNTSTLNAQNHTAWAAESVGADFALAAIDATHLKITPTRSGAASYSMVFTIGTATSPAIFGAITTIP